MNPIGHGVDFSHWQREIPAAAAVKPQHPWTTVCVVRACYGEKPDKRAKEHFRRALDLGFDHVGLYLYWRYYNEPWDQLTRFLDIARDVGLGDRDSDLVPILDVESEHKRAALKPSHMGNLAEMLGGLALDFDGVLPMIYGNESDFARLGSPRGLLEHKIWASDYTGDMHWPQGAQIVMRQHRVSPWRGFNPTPGFEPVAGAIDQSIVLKPLPTFGVHYGR